VTARRTLLMLVTVFVLPVVLAWVFARGPSDWRPIKTTNYGVLLRPSLGLSSHGVRDDTGAALAVDAVGGDWFLVVLHNTACTEPCRRWVQLAEYVQIAVGRDTPRVTVAVLGPEDDAPTTGSQHWRLPPDGKLVGALRRAMGAPQLETTLLIVDHQGRVVLMYPTDEDGPGVLKDLKRLLRATAPP
jgi:cytochrome oxidase Cu insertion factor (SCO1/SenC/PrrC family)